MSARDLPASVREVMSLVLGVPEQSLIDGASPATLPEWDSFRHLLMVLAIEETFGIRFGVEEMEAMASVRNIVETVRLRMAPA